MLNIINEVQHYLNKHLKAAVGGLHMYSRSTGISESPEIIFHIAQCLMSTKVPLYTCHCTGEQAYLILKETMKDQINYVRTGSSLIL
jgi:7,8-dihydropterin-6-yl-methyl-4-(beta-D-ribofuranosyl)aminobenzene 5'-phosphate synthase